MLPLQIRFEPDAAGQLARLAPAARKTLERRLSRAAAAAGLREHIDDEWVEIEIGRRLRVECRTDASARTLTVVSIQRRAR